MTRHTVTLGRLFDIRVGIHASWLVVFAFVTVALARDVAPAAPAYGFAAVCALGLFASVVAHEFAHALVARRFGVRTREIALFLFGGVATLEDEPPAPRADALIAAAGPLFSALAAVAALALAFVCARVAPGAAGASAVRLCTYLALANAVLAGFNAIPAYPTDGGRVLRALLWRRTGSRETATALAARVGIGFALTFVVAAVLGTAATQNPFYLWYVLLGAYLLQASWANRRAVPMRAPNVEVGAAA